MSTIYLDMDGVIADFWAGMYEHCGIKSKKYLPSKDESILALKGTNFFNTLPLFESSQTLVDFVRRTKDWGIISAPLRDDFTNCAYWKRVWLERYDFMPDNATKFIVTKKKQKYAINDDGTPNILIDDMDKNIIPWREKGGIAFQYEATKNNVHELIENIENNQLIVTKKVKK